MLTVNTFRMSSAIRWAFNWKEWNPSEREFQYAVACVQSDEKTRLGKFVYRKDVRASLAGRLLMRKFVNEYADLPYDKIIFVRDEHNRPVLKDHSTVVSFNVSHHGSYTVLAGEIRNVKLGVDIMSLEYIRGKSVSEFLNTMKRNFSPAEWEEIEGSVAEKPEMERISMFYRHWALKESYLKALGIGVLIDLKSLDFRTRSELSKDSVTTDTVLYIDGIKQDWLFEETLLDSQHCVAVALQENESSRSQSHNTFEMIDCDKLVERAIPLFPIDTVYTAQYFAKSEKP